MVKNAIGRRGGSCLAGMVLILAAASGLAWAGEKPDLTITNVTVLPMTGEGQAATHATVSVRDGRIVSIAPATKAACTGRCIDGTGKWLIPGLTDAHVHIENDHNMQLYMGLPERPVGAVEAADVFLPYIAHGVTQIFDLSAMPETLLQKNDIQTGRIAGPHIITAYMLDGPKPMWPEGMSHGIPNPEAGRQAVRDAATGGYDLIKVYSLLDLPTFLAIVDEAKTRGMKVIGHIPGRNQGTTESFLVHGFDAVARLVIQGAGLGIMPESAARRWTRRGQTRLLILDEPWADRRLMLCARTLEALPNYARALIQALQPQAGDPK